MSADTDLTPLREGEMAVEGRMPYSSNGTFLVRVAHEGTEELAVYKPVRGERPLWDFPTGLARREVAEAPGEGRVALLPDLLECPATIKRRHASRHIDLWQ